MSFSGSSTDIPTRPVVCHLIESLEHGGAEALTHRLAVGMRANGYTPVVCCLREGPVAEVLKRDGIRVRCLNLNRPSILRAISFAQFAFQLLRGLADIIETESVSVIHAHLPDSIISATCVGLWTRTPVIGTYHGLGVFPAKRSRLDPRNAFRRTLYRLAGRLSTRSIAVSEPVRDLLCRELEFDPQKTLLIVNGVDTTSFDGGDARRRPTADPGLIGRKVIVCVGRLVAGKGQRFLIEAMATVIARYPETALLLVGDGPERDTLKAHIHKLNLDDFVFLAGARGDVPELLAMADIFVLPSMAEGIPLALIEAMAAGKPVVATAVPGNLDVIGDDGCGVLVPPADSHSLADALGGLLGDPERAAAIGQRGRERARAYFDIRGSLAATLALYDEVIAERKALDLHPARF